MLDNWLRWGWWVCRLGVGGVFLAAGFLKAGDSEAFTLALLPFTFLPEGSVGAVAVGIVVAEILAGFLILLPRVYRFGAGLAMILSATFFGVLIWALLSGIIVNCGCFGDDSPPSVARMLVAVWRDFFLLAAAGWVALRPVGDPSPHAKHPGPNLRRP